jgi:hypothetical protein
VDFYLFIIYLLGTLTIDALACIIFFGIESPYCCCCCNVINFLGLTVNIFFIVTM